MNELRQILENLSAGCVLVVGDLMVDEYHHGHIERISPEAPVPILNLVKKESVLGGAGNVARNLQALGVTATVVGVIGADPIGDHIVELLCASGAAGPGIVRDERRTSTRKTRLVSLEHGQQVFRVDEESTHSVGGDIEAKIVSLIFEKASSAQAILCSDYLKGVLTEKVLKAVFIAGREHGIPTIVAPKDVNTQKYAGADILVPNTKELSRLVRTSVDGADWLTNSASELTKQLNLKALLVTRGSEGMSLFEPASHGLSRVDIPTMARNVYDVTGAGDTAIAAFSAAIAGGANWEAAARLANLAAGIVVGMRGTATVTVDRVQALLAEQELQTREIHAVRRTSALCTS